MTTGQEAVIVIAMKKLYRSTSNKMIGGVCAGLAEYFKIDPTIVRVVAVLLLLPGGLPGLLPYVVLWVVIPTKPVSTIASSDK